MFKLDDKEKRIIINLLFLNIKISYDIERIIVKKLRFLFLFLDIVLPKIKNKIVFQECLTRNSEALYNYINKNHSNEYQCLLFINTDKSKYPTLKELFDIYTAKYIVITDESMHFVRYFKSKRHTYINLYHGMPLKALGFTKKIIKKYHTTRFGALSQGYQIATSDFFKHIVNNCFKSDYNKVYIIGQPRTDMIWDENKKIMAQQLFNFDKYHKVVFYLPTYKEGCNRENNAQVSKEYNNIFYLDDFQQENFISLLEQQNILFIMKPHPRDEKFYQEHLNTLPKCKNFKIIFNDILEANNINVYNMLDFVDLMISDFSSIAFDYLILNRPVIYLDNLSTDYSQNRGFTLEDNYKILMPGHKVKTYQELEEKIIDSLTIDSMKELREKTLPLIHKYRDNKACERIFEIMAGLK